MRLSTFSSVISCEPTSATSSVPSVALDVPPQPAATSASGMSARRRARFMEKAPFAAVYSRCLARGQYSIDKSERLRKALFAQADLAIRRRVDRGVDAPAQVAQLGRAEHHLSDTRLAAAEDEVVRAGARELELRLLNQEQVLHRLRERT